MYSIFSIITGAFAPLDNIGITHGQLLIANGVLEIIQIQFQISFLFNLKEKILQEEQENKRPGRQYVTFSFLFNISQWLVLTFEIQKFRASLIQSNFYGVMPWIIIQRVTL